jgi:hypothetical protein
MTKRWQKKERKDKDLFQGKLRPRSGGLWFAPGDVTTEEFLIDCKSTEHKSFSITESIWDKIHIEALKSRKLPCLSILLGDGTEVVVLDKNDFLSFFKEKKL